MSSSTPTPTDTGFFTDTDQLDQFTSDMRASDSKKVSDPATAAQTVDTFAAKTEAGAWASLDRATVASRLKDLIGNPRLLDQATLNLCGPAALFMEWIGRDPEAFATFATTLFDAGDASMGSLDIKPDSELVNADYNTLVSKGAGSRVGPAIPTRNSPRSRGPRNSRTGSMPWVSFRKSRTRPTG